MSAEKKKTESEMKKWDGYLDVPEDVSEKCKQAAEAFNFGNFKKARELSLELQNSSNETEKNIALEILNRTGVDNVVLYIALISIVVLVFIFAWAVNISH